MIDDLPKVLDLNQLFLKLHWAIFNYLKYDIMCHMVFYVTMITFRMMDELIRWPKPNIFLSATCDETLSWMIEIWMKNHLVNDSVCNIVNLQSPKKFTRNDK